MAKVKRLEYRIAGELHVTHVKFLAGRSTYRDGDGDFVIEFNADMALGLDKRCVKAKTMKEVIDLFKQAIADFETKKIERQKIIMYEFKASKRPIPIGWRVKNRYGDHYPPEKERNDFAEDERGLSLSWELAELVTRISGDKVIMNDRGHHVGSDDSTYVEWTQAREDWFKALDAALDGLVLGASGVLDRPAKTMADFIDMNPYRGSTLLLQDQSERSKVSIRVKK